MYVLIFIHKYINVTSFNGICLVSAGGWWACIFCEMSVLLITLWHVPWFVSGHLHGEKCQRYHGFLLSLWSHSYVSARPRYLATIHGKVSHWTRWVSEAMQHLAVTASLLQGSVVMQLMQCPCMFGQEFLQCRQGRVPAITHLLFTKDTSTN